MRVLFISSSELPDQCANSTRIVNLAKLMRMCGHSCTLIGIRYSEDAPLVGEYEGFTYYHMDAVKYHEYPKLKRAKFIKQLVLDSINELWKKSPFDLVVVSDFSFQNIQFLMNYVKRKDAYIALNAVEWYEKDNICFCGLGGKIKFLINRYKMVIEQPRLKNIIAISSYLADYYEKKRCNVLRIPTIVDRDIYDFNPENKNGKTIIAYAGFPGKKDYICNTIRALQFLNDEEKDKLELHLYGISDDELIHMGITADEIKKMRNLLYAHGRIPYDDVQAKIAGADFTVLLRPNLRYANAGFPTKVGESMMCGTPVIANRTSDLHVYIRDGETGIIVDNETAEACVEGLRRALNMNSGEKYEMRQAARIEAEKSFYFGGYYSNMTRFVKELKSL